MPSRPISRATGTRRSPASRACSSSAPVTCLQRPSSSAARRSAPSHRVPTGTACIVCTASNFSRTRFGNSYRCQASRSASPMQGHVRVDARIVYGAVLASSLAMRPLLAIVLATAACAPGTDDETFDPSGGKADGSGSAVDGHYISADSVQVLRAAHDPAAKLASLSPPFEKTYRGDLVEAWEYLKPIGTLGFFGPLGPYGPLGKSGPVGFRYVN